MKAVVVESPGVMTVIDVEPPTITTAHEVLVRVTAAGICGSDLHIYDGSNAAATYPRVLGHEVVGVVEQVGSAVRSVRTGDRLILNQVIACGACRPCRLGRGNVCARLRVRGVHVDGGFQDLVAVPESDCHLLPDSLSDADAVMIEPVTIALQACARAQVTEDDTVLIIGYGALGSTILKVALPIAARVLVADISRSRLNEAEAEGAAATFDLSAVDLEPACRKVTNGEGATVTIDAACTGDSLLQALRATANAGRVVSMGFSADPTAVSPFLITSKELDVRGSRLQNHRFPEAIRLVREGAVQLAGTVTHQFPLVDAQAAFELLGTRDPGVRKVVLTPGG